MFVFFFVIFTIFIVMKKVIRLTESDLTRIVKRVIQEEQVNESKLLKNLMTSLGLSVALNIGLTSCETKSDLKDKKEDIEFIVKKDLEDQNKYYDYDDSTTFKKIDKIRGPFREKPVVMSKDRTKWVEGKDSVTVYFIISEGFTYYDDLDTRVWLVTTYMEPDDDKKESYTSTITHFKYDEALESVNKSISRLNLTPEEMTKTIGSPNDILKK